MNIRNDAQKCVRGQLVEVRSIEEIFGTLDGNRKFEGVLFMPEMVRYCGTQARVFRRANKTCVEGHGTRRMKDTVCQFPDF